MRGARARRSWSELRAPAGGVRVTRQIDPAEALKNRMIDMYVSEYDDALRRDDRESAARLAAALRTLGVRI